MLVGVSIQQAAATPIAIVGPTASGKSSLAVALAERVGGEIISVDSMQVYRGLDIGTAKPAPADRERVPHHLIDVAALTNPFDAAQFVQLAQSAVLQIQQRGRIPILCGGTGLYLQAFLEGLGTAPAPDPGLRAELEAAPIAELLAELERTDPAAFDRIDRLNPRRVIRALEVIRLSGRPFFEQQARWSREERPGVIQSIPVIGLMRDRVDLCARIEARIDRMFQEGLVLETQEALRLGLQDNRTAQQAIGYRQVLGYLRGEQDLAETIRLVKRRSTQFARRQMTWFRKHSDVTWIRLQSQEPTPRVIDHLLEVWARAGSGAWRDDAVTKKSTADDWPGPW
jgi:tRNA dimethylallyltransferase